MIFFEKIHISHIYFRNYWMVLDEVKLERNQLIFSNFSVCSFDSCKYSFKIFDSLKQYSNTNIIQGWNILNRFQFLYDAKILSFRKLMKSVNTWFYVSHKLIKNHILCFLNHFNFDQTVHAYKQNMYLHHLKSQEKLIYTGNKSSRVSYTDIFEFL